MSPIDRINRIDYKKEWKQLYHASAKQAGLVDVPKLNYLKIDGAGDPNTAQSFQEAVHALFALSYTLKFMAKNHAGQDYVVMPLEGLWWSDDISSFSMQHKGQWKWTLMMMQPPFISLPMVQQAKEQVWAKNAKNAKNAKKGSKSPKQDTKQDTKHNLSALPLVYFEPLEEGPAAQIMHLGPFSTEGPTVAKLHEFIEQSGHQRRGKHHEIYLKDMRKAAPANWKTIIRHPIAIR